jgi:hypothetical protein
MYQLAWQGDTQSEFEACLSDWLARTKLDEQLRSFVRKQVLDELRLWPQPGPELPQIQETKHFDTGWMRLTYFVDSTTGVVTVLSVERKN